MTIVEFVTVSLKSGDTVDSVAMPKSNWDKNISSHDVEGLDAWRD